MGGAICVKIWGVCRVFVIMFSWHMCSLEPIGICLWCMQRIWIVLFSILGASFLL